MQRNVAFRRVKGRVVKSPWPQGVRQGAKKAPRGVVCRGEPVCFRAYGLRPCACFVFLLHYNLRAVYDVDTLGQLAEHVGRLALAYVYAVDCVNLHCAVCANLDAVDADR